jgi:hypothetical protein
MMTCQIQKEPLIEHPSSLTFHHYLLYLEITPMSSCPNCSFIAFDKDALKVHRRTCDSEVEVKFDGKVIVLKRGESGFHWGYGD